MQTRFTRRHFIHGMAALGIGWAARARAQVPVAQAVPVVRAIPVAQAVSAPPALPPPPPFQLTVDRYDWGTARPDDIKAVVGSAGDQIWQHCSRSQLDLIKIYHRRDFPVTDILRDWKGRISIGLASKDTRWAQFAFQFGHEFCHALTQHSSVGKHGWHNLQHANMWFEESICETGSLFALRRMGERWRTAPPFPQWRGYASAFSMYAAARMALPEHRLPPGVPFAAWFHQNELALRACAVLRDKDTIIASQMLPILEANPAGWEALCYLNLGSRDLKKPLARHFTEWGQNVPSDLRPFVSKIAALFEVAV